MEFTGLSPEDRRHGYVTLALISEWSDWVKRRTETIEFVGDATVRRRVAVDFTLRSYLLQTPLVWWGDTGIHYLPIALLEKQPLAAFSLRDERDGVVPRLTRVRTAGIAAGSLIALAQAVIARRLRDAARERDELGQFKRVNARSIALPRSLEKEFWYLAYLDTVDRSARRAGDEHPDAETVLQTFAAEFLDATGDPPPAPENWTWQTSAPRVDGATWEAPTVATAAWRAALIQHEGFSRLAYDLSRTHLLSIPIAHRPGDRRVIKYAYNEPIKEPILALWHQTKIRPNARRFFAQLRRTEDRLEGLPASEFPLDEWYAVGEDQPRDTIRVLTKLLRAATWRAKRLTFDTPAVGWGGSYHCELVAPEGIQVRRAGLVARGPGEHHAKQRALRGARSLARAQLYVSDVALGRAGKAEVALKPRSSTIVRGAALTATLVVGAVALTLLHLDRIQRGRRLPRRHGSASVASPRRPCRVYGARCRAPDDDKFAVWAPCARLGVGFLGRQRSWANDRRPAHRGTPLPLDLVALSRYADRGDTDGGVALSGARTATRTGADRGSRGP